jgi:hypothetical protein
MLTKVLGMPRNVASDGNRAIGGAAIVAKDRHWIESECRIEGCDGVRREARKSRLQYEGVGGDPADRGAQPKAKPT